jgi:hypothetical protein
MTTQKWTIPLRDGRTLVHGRRPDPTSPNGKKYWYEIDGESGLDGMPKTDIPLYAWERLKEDDTYVVITEGEKATDALLDCGIVAVGTATGASGKTIPCDESLNVVLGRTVYLWADHDDSGTKHMDTIAAQLFKLGANDIREVVWTEAPHKGDAADFVGDDKSLLALIQAATPRERPDGDLATLLSDICTFINKYVVLLPTQVDTIALWVLHTWTFNGCDTTPYLAISSAEKQSGKTRLFEVMELLVNNPWMTGATSEAALFRKINQGELTLLFDEADATFKGNHELENSLRGILNNGSRRGGRVSRVATNGNFEVQEFSVYCPKAFAGIGKSLPDTVADRSIPIELKRKTNREQVTKFRWKKVTAESEPLRTRIEAWAEYNEVAVAQGIEDEPLLPDALSDRAADGWEPLVVIADLAGESWGNRARNAATTLMKVEDDGSRGVQLLRDIHQVMKLRGNPANIPSADLLAGLKEDIDESPWQEFDWSKNKLAHGLKPYEIKPRAVRIGDKTPRGYRRKDFMDAWSRYTPDLNATVQHLGSELESIDEGLLETSNVADGTSPETPLFELNVAPVAGTTPSKGGEPLSQEFVDPSGVSITKIKL